MAPINDTPPPEDVSLRRKVDFLCRPASYPETTAEVDTIETHMSWVFLTDWHVYKLKKPVRTRFADLRSIEERRVNAENEVRLNGRLAPHVYLGLATLTCGTDDRLAIDGAGTVIDWLVLMQRLPAARMLDHALAGDAADETSVARAAAHLARFFADAQRVELAPDHLRSRLADEMRANRDALSATHPRVETLVDRQRRALEDRAGPVGRELGTRPIVEGHGDLRPEHIALTDPPVVIDCLEFSRELRLLDPVDELSYLALECERLDAPWIGDQFLDTYIELSGDAPPDALIDLYKSHRALVRARLAHAHTEEDGRDDHDHWRERAREYIDLAEHCSDKSI